MKVSVVIPNYNHARFLAARIDSVLGQSFRDFDVLILDDASTDDSRDVIQRYVGGRVRFEPNARNSGSTFAQWEKAFARTSGEYVWIAESDDEASPAFLERMAAVLEARSEVAFVHCQSTLIDEHGKAFGLAQSTVRPDGSSSVHASDFVREGREDLRDCVRFLSPPCATASAVLFRRRSVEAAGGVDRSFRLCGDLSMYARLASIGHVGYLAEPLNRYRWHGGTVRSRTELDGSAIWERYRFFREFADRASLTPGEREEALKRMVSNWVATTCRKDSKLTFRRHREIWGAARSVDADVWRHLGASVLGHFKAAWQRRRNSGTPG